MCWRWLKLSPLAMIPHNVCKYRVILDPSFVPHITGYSLRLINKATNEMAPESAISRTRKVLPCIVVVTITAPIMDVDIMISKIDITVFF